MSMMGGSVGVESAPGRGSTFWLTLPFEEGAKDAAQDTTPRAASSSLDGMRVIVVDDNETNRIIIDKHVGSWGMVSDMAESGEQALELLRSSSKRGSPFDLAILDFHMPKMNGIELAREIRKDPAIARTRLVMLTSSPIAAEELDDASILAHLSKPVRKSELYNCLIQVVGGKSPVRGHESEVQRAPIEKTGGRILVAEDNPVNQEVVREMLKDLGCEVHCVGNGREAIDALPLRKYDVVLMDCQMPELDGYGATRLIRQMEQSGEGTGQGRSRLPIIALTAHAMQKDREECIATGMDDYLSKPFTQEQIFRVLSRWLPESEAERLESGEGEPSSQKTAEGPATLDPAALATIRELEKRGSTGFVDRVIQAYLDSSPQYLENLAEAIVLKDATAAFKAAHTLKSSSANLGAVRLSELCRELEHNSRAGDTDDGVRMLSEIKAEFELVQQALSEELQGSLVS